MTNFISILSFSFQSDSIACNYLLVNLRNMISTIYGHRVVHNVKKTFQALNPGECCDVTVHVPVKREFLKKVNIIGALKAPRKSNGFLSMLTKLIFTTRSVKVEVSKDSHPETNSLNVEVTYPQSNGALTSFKTSIEVDPNASIKLDNTRVSASRKGVNFAPSHVMERGRVSDIEGLITRGLQYSLETILKKIEASNSID